MEREVRDIKSKLDQLSNGHLDQVTKRNTEAIARLGNKVNKCREPITQFFAGLTKGADSSASSNNSTKGPDYDQ